MTDKIHILLPVYNRRDITQSFMECLKAQTFQDYHLILIDDGSTDGTEEMVRHYTKDIMVIRGRGEWWWAGSLQQAYNWLKSQKLPSTDTLLIINDDTEFKTNFLETALKVLSQHKKTLLLAQCYSRGTGQLIDAGVHVDWSRLSFEPAKTPDLINCLSTRGLFLRIADFYEIGGFYPKVLPHYLSDYEFTIRAKRRGMKLITDPLVKLWLDENSTGYHKIVKEPLSRFFKKQFSKKSAANPFAWSAFLILACPWPWKIPNLIRIWGAFIYKLSALILSPKRLMKRMI